MYRISTIGFKWRFDPPHLSHIGLIDSDRCSTRLQTGDVTTVATGDHQCVCRPLTAGSPEESIQDTVSPLVTNTIQLLLLFPYCRTRGTRVYIKQCSAGKNQTLKITIFT